MKKKVCMNQDYKDKLIKLINYQYDLLTTFRSNCSDDEQNCNWIKFCNDLKNQKESIEQWIINSNLDSSSNLVFLLQNFIDEFINCYLNMSSIAEVLKDLNDEIDNPLDDWGNFPEHKENIFAILNKI